MKLLTRNTDYAIRAVSFIAKKGKDTISASELVKELRIPHHFLRKILQTLNKNDILKSYKGKGGGFRLSRPSDKINLLDLIKVFQGDLKLNECFFKKLVCPNKRKCILKKKIDKIEKYVLSELAVITVKDLLS